MDDPTPHSFAERQPAPFYGVLPAPRCDRCGSLRIANWHEVVNPLPAAADSG